MAALQYVGDPGYSALILRRTYAELTNSTDGLIPRAHQWLQGTDAVWSGEHRRWTFPSGAMLEFGHVEHEQDKHKYQSAAYQFIGFDELTSFTRTQYEFIGFTRARRVRELAHIPIRIRAASNPGNVGHGWVKSRFITHRADGVVFVPARVADNPGLDVDEYVRTLSRGAGDILRTQMLEGDWGVFEGAAFPEFRDTIHVVDAFPVPHDWERFEFMDFGISNPTAWYVAAVDYDGNIVIFDEYYEPGLVSKHAREIRRRRAAWWPEPDGPPLLGESDPIVVADPAVRNRTGTERATTKHRWGEAATIRTEFEDNGIRMRLGNNDRTAGRARVAELLYVDPARRPPYWAPQLDGATEAPRLYLVGSRCPHLREQIQTAPLLPIDAGVRGAGEIVDPGWETEYGHSVAALRYGAMSRPKPGMPPDEETDDPRQAFLEKVTAARFSDDDGRYHILN
jgi:hypothetical protein